MNRRDLELIASVIRGLPFAEERRVWVAVAFATSIAAEHPSFNRQKFYTACNVKMPSMPAKEPSNA